MNKLLIAVVASTFAFGSVAGYAADTTKKEELTKEQRTDMRSRADKLTQDRTQAGTPVKTDVKATAPAAKTPVVKKTKKTSHRTVKKVQPKA
jgi:Ni/Co efflux regulator RcnB